MSFTRIFLYRNTIRIFINTTYNTQTTEYCKAGVSKHVSFFININLIEISRSCFLNSAYLRDFLFGLRLLAEPNGLSISIPFTIQERRVLELQVCSYHLNIGQDWLNIALNV